MLRNVRKSIGNAVTPFLTAPIESPILVFELQLIIKLPSIVEMPVYADDIMLTQEQRDAIFWSNVNVANNKRVVTHWNDRIQNHRLLEFIVFRRDPYYVENLLTRFTSLASFVLEAGTSLCLSVEATNTGLLSANDSLTVWGQYEILENSSIDIKR